VQAKYCKRFTLVDFSSEERGLGPLYTPGDGYLCGLKALATSYNAILNDANKTTTLEELMSLMFSSVDHASQTGTPTAKYEEWIKDQNEPRRELVVTKEFRDLQLKAALYLKDPTVCLGIIVKNLGGGEDLAYYMPPLRPPIIWVYSKIASRDVVGAVQIVDHWEGIGPWRREADTLGLRDVARWGFQHPRGDGGYSNGAEGAANAATRPNISLEVPDPGMGSSGSRARRSVYGNKPEVMNMQNDAKERDCK